MINKDDVIVGLDIGSTKTCAVIGEVDSKTGKLEITGVGTCSSTGLKKGIVTNIEATVVSVETAVSDAEMMSGKTVRSTWTGIGGSHVTGIPSRGAVSVRKTRENRNNSEAREISNVDVERALAISKEVMIPMDREVLEVIPQTYIIDGNRGYKDPLNMIGVRLEVEAQIITCSVTGAHNLIKCVNRAGFKVNDLVLQNLAAGRSVLFPAEKDQGVAVIDLGGGTTDLLIYFEGAPFSMATIPVGGSQVTNDISILKKISLEYAEKIKLETGCCWEPFLEEDSEILVPGIGGRPPKPIPRSEIMSIIKPRMEEIFKLVYEKLAAQSQGRILAAGVVLTGGGALLSGAPELAADIFDLPVRIGLPRTDTALPEEYRNPVYATAIGLALEGFEREGRLPVDSEMRQGDRIKNSKWEQIKNWLRKEFL